MPDHAVAEAHAALGDLLRELRAGRPLGVQLVLDTAQLLGGRAARYLASSILKLRLKGVGGPSSGNQSTYPSLHPIFEKYLNISEKLVVL